MKMTAKVRRTSAQLIVVKEGVRRALLIIASCTYSDRCNRTFNILYSAFYRTYSRATVGTLSINGKRVRWTQKLRVLHRC
jgi:hypothetical protein